MLYGILIFILLIFPGIISFDYIVIQKLPEKNKFKQWWRKHLIADYN